MESSELFNKRKNMLVNSGIIILALIVSFNIYKKQSGGKFILNSSIQSEQKKNKVLENIKQLNVKVNAFKRLLIRQEVSHFINTISGFGETSKVKITSIRPGKENRKNDYIEFPFDIAVSAPNYHTLGRFISQIESSSDVYMIDSLQAQGDSQKGLNVSMSVKSIIFTDNLNEKKD